VSELLSLLFRCAIIPLCYIICFQSNKSCAHLDDPRTVGKGHDVPLLPEEGGV